MRRLLSCTPAREWEFTHTTTSPYHSQSNGKAESSVKIAKTLIKKATRKSKDLYIALLEWRNTPAKDGPSACQKLFSRRTRTLLPTAETLLEPNVAENIPENIELRRRKAKQYFDKQANIGQPVRLQPQNPRFPWSKGSCVAKVGPRSYLIKTSDGLYRRNRKFIPHTLSLKMLKQIRQKLQDNPRTTWPKLRQRHRPVSHQPVSHRQPQPTSFRLLHLPDALRVVVSLKCLISTMTT